MFARKTAFQSYSAADHIMRKHSPPLPTLNTPEQRREKSKTNDNVAQTAATLAGMFPLWLKVHSQIIPLQLTQRESIVAPQPGIIATTQG